MHLNPYPANAIGKKKQKYSRIFFRARVLFCPHIELSTNWHIKNAPFFSSRGDVETKENDKNTPKWAKEILKQDGVTGIKVNAHTMSIFLGGYNDSNLSGVWKNAKQVLIKEGILDRDAVEIC